MTRSCQRQLYTVRYTRCIRKGALHFIGRDALAVVVGGRHYSASAVFLLTDGALGEKCLLFFFVFFLCNVEPAFECGAQAASAAVHKHRLKFSARQAAFSAAMK